MQITDNCNQQMVGLRFIIKVQYIFDRVADNNCNTIGYYWCLHPIQFSSNVCWLGLACLAFAPSAMWNIVTTPLPVNTQNSFFCIFCVFFVFLCIIPLFYIETKLLPFLTLFRRTVEQLADYMSVYIFYEIILAPLPQILLL